MAEEKDPKEQVEQLLKAALQGDKTVEQLEEATKKQREFAKELNNKIDHDCYMINIGENVNFFNLYI